MSLGPWLILVTNIGFLGVNADALDETKSLFNGCAREVLANGLVIC